MLPGVVGTVVITTLDCNGATLSNTFSYSPNTGSVMTINCPFVLCTAGKRWRHSADVRRAFYFQIPTKYFPASFTW